MEEQKKEEMTVPYVAHKEAMSAQERHIGRLIYTIIFIVVFFVGAMLIEAGIFVWFLNQYEYTNEVVTVDSTDGVANYIGNNGDIHNGERSGEDRREDQSDPAENHEAEE